MMRGLAFPRLSLALPALLAVLGLSLAVKVGCRMLSSPSAEAASIASANVDSPEKKAPDRESPEREPATIENFVEAILTGSTPGAAPDAAADRDGSTPTSPDEALEPRRPGPRPVPPDPGHRGRPSAGLASAPRGPPQGIA